MDIDGYWDIGMHGTRRPWDTTACMDIDGMHGTRRPWTLTAMTEIPAVNLYPAPEQLLECPVGLLKRDTSQMACWRETRSHHP